LWNLHGVELIHSNLEWVVSLNELMFHFINCMLYRDIIHTAKERSFEPDFAELVIPELPKFVTQPLFSRRNPEDQIP